MPASGRWTSACKAHGGFDHNAQTLRVVTALEHRYPEFDGLNLTWESLEGIVKHNGPLTERERGRRSGATASSGIPVGISDYNRKLRSGAVELCLAGGAGRGHSPTTSPMTPTTSTTACAPACFAVDDLKAMPLTARHHRRDRHALSRARRRQARRRTGARADLLSDQRGHLGGAASAWTPRSRNPPTTSAIHGEPLIAFPPSGAGGGRDQGVPEAAGCTATSG